MDLVSFLRARLDEDERVATVLGDDMRQSWAIPEDESVAVIHMHRHAPARVLAEVDAKRRILDEYEQATGQYATHSQVSAGEEIGLRFAVKALALPYAEHPSYDEAWRP